MVEPARLADGHVSTYALGLKMERYRGTEVIHHSGAIWGGNCQMLTVPSRQLDVIIMVNSGAPRATELAWQVVDLLEGDSLPAPTSRPAPADAYPHLAGVRYLDRQGTLVEFSAVDGTLGVTVAGMSSPVMLREQGDTLQVGFEAYGQGPMRWRCQDLAAAAEGPPAQIPMMVGATDDRLNLVPPAPSDATLMRDLVGRYHSEDLAATAEIGGAGPMRLALRGDYGPPRTFRIVPCTVSVCRLIDEAEPLETFQLTLERGRAGITGFRVDTFRARRLRFDRMRG